MRRVSRLNQTPKKPIPVLKDKPMDIPAVAAASVSLKDLIVTRIEMLVPNGGCSGVPGAEIHIQNDIARYRFYTSDMGVINDLTCLDYDDWTRHAHVMDVGIRAGVIKMLQMVPKEPAKATLLGNQGFVAGADCCSCCDEAAGGDITVTIGPVEICDEECDWVWNV